MTLGQRRLRSSVVCPGSRVRLTSACGRSRPCADPVSPAFPPTRRPAEVGLVLMRAPLFSTQLLLVPKASLSAVAFESAWGSVA